MSATSSFYNKNAKELAKLYNGVPFTQVHSGWRAFYPQEGDKVLDVGAGTGRDAKWFSEQGCEVIAIEPSKAMRTQGKALTGESVTWLDDSLPVLTNTHHLGIRFDLILVSAVWVHLADSHRERAFRKLSNLLAPNGRLVITLRHGDFEDERQTYPVTVEQLEQLSKQHGLYISHVSDGEDQLQRVGVSWQSVVMVLPDDGSGGLNKVRHIIMNDSKSSTYKLALLRSLLRIADAHSGAVIDRSDGNVALPLGLVALYWIRQYKRLLDKEDLQQNSNTEAGLGFVKPDGWGKLSHLTADDLSIGSLFMGEEAKALDKAFRSSIDVIKSNPVKFTYDRDKSNPYFSVERERSQFKGSIMLDGEQLASYGKFVLSEGLWDCFRLYHSWIEPLVVNQWVREMQRFKGNQERGVSLQTYHDCLVWIDEKRSTTAARSRVQALRAQSEDIVSVWSGSNLRDEYHIDHCLPFAFWPNNDKWNLLPTSKNENLTKRDRVPSASRLASSKQRVIDWWTLAWGSDPQLKQSFFSEASLSLPAIRPELQEFEAVFEAMGLQACGVKSRLMVGEW